MPPAVFLPEPDHARDRSPDTSDSPGAEPRRPGGGSRRPEQAEQQSPPGVQAGEEHAAVIPADLPPVGTQKVLIAVGAFVGLLIGVFLLGYLPHRARAVLARADAEEARTTAPAVSVMTPKLETEATNLVLPGDVQAYQYTSIFPRTNGYLKRLLVDIGDHVTNDQLLAEIDTPEVDAQLLEDRANAEQARANLVKAESDENLAKITYDRYLAVSDKRAVSQQDVDDKRAAWEQAKAGVEVAKAAIGSADSEVKRLEVLQAFEKVTAPFTGTITVRNFYVGALLSPTSTGPGKEMFQIAETDVLRVFVNVPQAYAADVQVGKSADLIVRNYPGRTFEGQITRTAAAVDPMTRTLRVEVDVPNPESLLFAGMYGEVQFHVTSSSPPLLVPTSALVYNADGLSLGVVKEGQVHFQKVAVGRDFGNELEITEGLTGSEDVITNPGERLKEGLKVRIASPSGEKPVRLAKSAEEP